MFCLRKALSSVCAVYLQEEEFYTQICYLLMQRTKRIRPFIVWLRFSPEANSTHPWREVNTQITSMLSGAEKPPTHGGIF